ncbi:ROK family transcriptional regulator [Actinoallomurus purpureus]|uniref:ROK family transcriptional regulator n=1 Tax=Actinoallomurus purpureus TaxID=478114 RepID=UPI002093FBDB|nr:ROK family transcriptional regulator [Actinoallomurus purpureus]MCO6003653.1 ROK family transcriptional regulator [Actinoallomurus purpureus]
MTREPMPAGTGPHVLRRINVVTVLTALREGGPQRVADLVTATGLSRPAVSRAIDTLRAEGWAEDADQRSGAGGEIRVGRPAAVIRFRSEAGHVLGADVGPHKILAMVSDLAGNVIAERREDTHRLRGGEEVLRALLRITTDVLAEAGVPAGDVLSAAIGSPGLVDTKTGTVTLAPSIPGWASIPVAAELRSLLACPLSVHNDVNLAVLAERWRGTATEADDLVFVQWGARVGAGIMIDGRLLRGTNAAAGEIGFLDLAEHRGPDGPHIVTRDTMGPFERQVGASAIIELALAEAERQGDARLRELMLRARPHDDVAALFDAASAGSALAESIVDQIAARFARGLAAACLLLDPELIVIGGGVSRAGARLLTVVERHLRRRTLVRPRLALSSLGDTAVALGATRSALDDVERRHLSPDALGASR